MKTPPEESSRPLPVLRLVGPADKELEELEARLHISPSLLKQVQTLDVAPGMNDVQGQRLIRLDVPQPNEGMGLKWKRVDVLLTDDLVAVVQPDRMEVMEKALGELGERVEDTTPDELLALIANAVVDGFEDLRGSISHEAEVINLGPAATRKAIRLLHEDARELHRGIDVCRRVLSDVERSVAFTDESNAELKRAIDRLRSIDTAIETERERLPPAPPTATEEIPNIDVESPEIVETAVALGHKRLQRLGFAHALTGLMGGLAVSFGAVAMSWAGGVFMDSVGFEKAHFIGALFFPIGFVVLMLGKGELFTENFFVPVTGVLHRRGTVKDLLALWSTTLVSNLVAAVIFSWLITRPNVLPHGAQQFIGQLASEKVAQPFVTAFVRAIFAGWLMTLLTWLMLASKSQGVRVTVAAMVGLLIALGSLNHVIVSASECFIAIGGPHTISVSQWFTHNFLPALSGNVVGGLVFVTLLGYMQAVMQKKSEESMKEAFHEERQSEPS